MKKAFEGSKDINMAENNVTILSAINDKSRKQIKELAAEMISKKKSLDNAEEIFDDENEKIKPEKKKGFVCTICGYIYEGDTLPENFVCPLCGQGPEVFEPVDIE